MSERGQPETGETETRDQYDPLNDIGDEEDCTRKDKVLFGTNSVNIPNVNQQTKAKYCRKHSMAKLRMSTNIHVLGVLPYVYWHRTLAVRLS